MTSVLTLPTDPIAELRLRTCPPIARVEKRVRLAWAFLFFNILTYATFPTLVPIPSKIGKALTEAALAVAFVLALTANPKIRIRPNLFLIIFSVLEISTLMMSLRFVSLGTDFRAVRLGAFLVVLWMLTPWWGWTSYVLLRSQVTAVSVAAGSALVGLVLAHHKALSFQGRLSGAIWPMPPPQVAHYAGEAAGLTVLLWLCGMVSRRRAILVIPLGTVVLLMTHTRTALLGTIAGLFVGALSLFTSRKRVRRVFTSVLIVVALAGPIASPFIASWLMRGQSSSELTQLTGRTKTWDLLLTSPRPESNKIFGSGLSNDSVDGLPIDNGWLSAYLDQGVVGDVLIAAMFLLLILAAGFAPRGPSRAFALFLIVYCLVASYTETGLGQASSYTLDLTLAASLLAAPITAKKSLRPFFLRTPSIPEPSRLAVDKNLIRDRVTPGDAIKRAGDILTRELEALSDDGRGPVAGNNDVGPAPTENGDDGVEHAYVELVTAANELAATVSDLQRAASKSDGGSFESQLPQP